MAEGGDELIPAVIVERLLAGNEHPLKIWREYRGLTQKALGAIAGTGKSHISQIESGHKRASTKIIIALAAALNVDIEDLITD